MLRRYRRCRDSQVGRDDERTTALSLLAKDLRPLSDNEHPQRLLLLWRHGNAVLDFLEDLLGWVCQVPLEDLTRNADPCPRAKLSLVVKRTDRVIPADTEIRCRVEENARRAPVVAAPVLFGILAHVRPAIAVTIAVDGDRTVLCLGRVGLENRNGHRIVYLIPELQTETT